MFKFKNVLCFETQFLTFTQIGLQKTPLLVRRGAETDERSESDEAGWWNSHFIYVPFWIFFLPAFFGNIPPPPRHESDRTFGAAYFVPPLLTRRGII